MGRWDVMPQYRGAMGGGGARGCARVGGAHLSTRDANAECLCWTPRETLAPGLSS